MEHRLYKLEEGLKVTYNIEEANQTLIEDMLAKAKFADKATKIETGAGGYLLLNVVNSKYVNILRIHQDFDPLQADQKVNPMVNGHRLSSYIFYVWIGEKLLKIVPRLKIKI